MIELPPHSTEVLVCGKNKPCLLSTGLCCFKKSFISYFCASFRNVSPYCDPKAAQILQ
jgi:hypothetical protein